MRPWLLALVLLPVFILAAPFSLLIAEIGEREGAVRR